MNLIIKSLEHPNLVEFVESYQSDSADEQIIVMREHGIDLEKYKEEKGILTFTESEARRILYRVFKGLMTLHLHNFGHLDIKADNILFDESSGEAKITDMDFVKNNSDQRIRPSDYRGINKTSTA